MRLHWAGNLFVPKPYNSDIRFGSKKPPYKVGIYLGSFNPIHNGHLQLAKQARDQFKLDAVEIVPLTQPAHKKTDFMSDAVRLLLTGLAVKRQPKLVASPLDMVLKEPSLAEFNARYPEPQAKVKWILQRTLNLLDAVRLKYEALSKRPVELSYIVGVDGLAGYPQAWAEPEYGEFLRKARLLVAPRPGGESIRKVVKAIKGVQPHLRYNVLRVIPNTASSTQVQERMKAGQPIPKSMVPKAVARFLQQFGHRLFLAQSA